MFYSSNENYMQDLYAYNQVPVNTYNPYMGNPAGMNNMMFGMNQNPNGMQSFNMNQGVNPNNLYPSIYRIINPVVNRVLSRSNIPYMTEDILNNMVDTVYNIVEGQIEPDDIVSLNQQQSNQVSETINRNQNNTSNTLSNTNSSTNSRTINDNNSRTVGNSSNSNNANIPNNSNSINTNTFSNQNTNSARRNNRHDSLLRDLIKILILKQILSNRNQQQNPYINQGQFMQNSNFIEPGFYNQNF